MDNLADKINFKLPFFCNGQFEITREALGVYVFKIFHQR